MKNNSLGKNAILNGIKSVVTLLFPLISFPYVAGILQVDNLGKYNFAFSIVSYFVLLAALGIPTYAIREGAKFRENKAQISVFASEMFSINIVSTVIAYLLLVVLVLGIDKFQEYSKLIFIFSVQIIFSTLGVEWIYSIFEDYAYIAKRSIIFQFLALVSMFIFIHNQNDYYIYAWITVGSVVGTSAFNWFHAKRMCNIRFTTSINWKKHLLPILIIFSSTIATTIYVNSDTIILGLMTNDYCVGIYSVAVKIYKIVKNLLSAILIVSIPRLSNFVGKGENLKFRETFKKIWCVMVIIITPAVLGLFLLSNELVLIISDTNYITATDSMRILSIALWVCLFGWLYSSCVLIPYKKEKIILKATIVSATINVVLNLILIPIWQEKAAALTTLVAEACQMFICIYYSKDLIRLNKIGKNVLHTMIGCGGICIICIGLKYLGLSLYLYTFSAISLSVLTYFAILIILKDKMAMEGKALLLNRLLKKTYSRKK